MRISYDKQVDALYIHLSEMPSVDSEEIYDGVVIDYAEDGRPVGIEFEHATNIIELGNLEAKSVPLEVSP